MSKLDSAGTLQGATVDLDALLRECCATLPPSSQDVSCQFQDGPGHHRGRRPPAGARHRQPAAQRPEICRQPGRAVGRTGPAGIEIAVDDDGPGIPETERDKVFEPFYRLDRSRDRATGGFGLGLSIAHKAVLLHGGALSIETSPLGGARFVVRLPQALK